MKSLYQINESEIKLFEEIDSLDGELTPELEKRLEIQENERENKYVAYHRRIQSFEYENKQIKEEIDRLNAIKKRNEKTISFLKSNLLDSIKKFGSITYGTLSFGLRKSTALSIDSNFLDKIPAKYLKPQPDKIDQALIKKDLKAGVPIEGCQLVNNQNLKIS